MKLREFYPLKTWANSKPPTACAIGASHANATGVRRFHSSTVNPAVSYLSLRQIYPSNYPKIASPMARAIRSTNAKISSTALAQVVVNQRAAKPTRWTRLSIRAGTTCATPVLMPAPWLMPAMTTGCQWISILAGLSTRFCTCCTRVFGPKSCAIWDWLNSTSRLKTCSRKAWC